MRILITLLGRIGDMVLITPMFRAIKKKYPDSEIDLIAGRQNYIVVEDNPRINNIIIFNKSPFELIKIIKKIRKVNYDYYIDPKDHFSTESRLLEKIVKARTKIGFNRPASSVFDISIDSDIDNFELHYVDRFLKTLNYLGIDCPAESSKPELFINPESEGYVNDYLNEISVNKAVLINLSAGKPERMWNAEKWTEVLKEIDEDIILTFLPSEKHIAEDLIAKSDTIHLFNSRSMKDVIALIHKVDLIVTPDTSLIHVASAFNTPIVALYTYNPLVFNKFHPLSTKQSVIMAEKGEASIHKLQPKRIVEEIKKLINELS